MVTSHYAAVKALMNRWSAEDARVLADWCEENSFKGMAAVLHMGPIEACHACLVQFSALFGTTETIMPFELWGSKETIPSWEDILTRRRSSQPLPGTDSGRYVHPGSRVGYMRDIIGRSSWDRHEIGPSGFDIVGQFYEAAPSEAPISYEGSYGWDIQPIQPIGSQQAILALQPRASQQIHTVIFTLGDIEMPAGETVKFRFSPPVPIRIMQVRIMGRELAEDELPIYNNVDSTPSLVVKDGSVNGKEDLIFGRDKGSGVPADVFNVFNRMGILSYPTLIVESNIEFVVSNNGTSKIHVTISAIARAALT